MKMLRLILPILKYFLLLIFGFGFAYIMSVSFGIVHIANIANMLMPFIFTLFSRIGIIILLLLGLAILSESMQ
ncbi:MAG: hypothetical protein HC908_03150 [Calothrix sp. SM1_7_51]|nr:hypothetical protein [Calothrix sp. SM1_7_51]